MPDTASPGAKSSDLRALRLENAALREALRARDDFMALASTELRNPMTPIVMAVQGLHGMAERGHGFPDRAAAVLAHLERAVARYRRRTAALLDTA